MFSVWILLTLLPILGGAQRFNCKGRILGAYYADAKSGCKAFHVCVRVAGGGIRDFRFFCPPGTLFHQEAQTCTDWGDDDPLACPADIYDGFDTKKLSSYGNRDDEAEFGLQRAETGDRRLSQNNVASNRPDTDLRAAHSSDFFSGHRDRGVDETAHASQPPSHIPSSSTSQSPVYTRQSFRRPSTQRTFPPTQNTSPAPSAPSQPSSRPQNDGNGKRKLVRKRPIYVSNKSTISTISPNTITQENYPQTTKQTQQNYNLQNYNLQPNYNQKQNLKNENNFNRRGSTQARQSTTSTTSTPDVPPQYREYKDEYVEVSRVTPKQNRHYPNSMYNPQTTSAQKFNKKEGLIEFFNYDAQSTPGLNVQNENEPFKVKHSFNVANPPRDSEFARSKNDNFNSVKEAPTIIDYSVSTRGFPTTTTAYKNYNSVSYEPEKNNFLPYSKHNNFNNYPTTTAAPATTIYTTSRPEPPPNLNTVAYNTNIGFNAQSNNYAESDEDDGQYHPPEGEDDGQYKPEIYNRELLEAAHSLNIAASGNRLPEDRKTYSKTRFSPKNSGHTIAPRPFKPAPITAQPTTTVPEIIYTTTLSPQTTYTQRTFDYIQTYTTTSRPADFLVGQTFAPTKEVPVRPTTTLVPRVTETRPPRPTSHAPAPPTQPQTAPPKPTTRPTNRAPTIPTHPKTTPPRPTTRPPNFAYPANKKEDNSYDYAYYDSDPGFVEYDHIEEFGKTNKKRS